jgi:pyruvate,water dikinase
VAELSGTPAPGGDTRGDDDHHDGGAGADTRDPDAEAQRIEHAFVAAELPAALENELVQVARRLAGGGRVAVRSSATSEDASVASFAGQYRSLLNVEPGDVPDAVRRVWASLWAPGVRTYRQARGVDDEDVAMAVVIMRMVDADTAGVVFTADPQGRPADLRIELVEGLAEKLVSGQVTPQVVVVPRQGPRRVPEELAVLVDRLVQFGTEAEERFGAPQDIEWAAAGDQVFLVQSRPIVAAPAPDDDGFDTPVAPDATYTSAGIAEMVPGLLPPLVWSLNGPMVNEAFRQLFDSLHVPPSEEPVVVRVRGRAALNLDLLRSVATVTGGSPREVERQYLGEVLSEDDEEGGDGGGGGFKLLAASWRAARLRQGLVREAATVRAAIDAVVGLEVSVDDLTPANLIAYRYQVHDLAARAVAAHVAVAVAAAASYRALELFLERYLGDEAPAVTQQLTAGQVAAAGGGAALDLDEVAASSDPQSALHAAARGAGSQAVFGGTTWDEEPERVSQALDAHIAAASSSRSDGVVESGGRDSLAALERRLTSGVRWRLTRLLTGQVVDVRLRMLRRLVDDATQFLTLREDMKLSVLQLGGESRRTTRRAAAILRATGVLADEADVELLGERELVRALQGRCRPALRSLAGRRRSLIRAERRGDLPRRFMGRPSSADEEVPEHPGEDRLEGWAASSGRHRGRPQVIRDPTSARLAAGDVLVANSTDPSWTSLFLEAGAIVVEEGGPLSHAAIVARELGVPAVVNVRGATDRLSDVASVTVDGDRGLVLLHETEGEAADDEVAPA